jgi:hypothetical protein
MHPRFLQEVCVSEQNIHRVYTQRKNEQTITNMISEEFESFTLQPVTGYYRGRPEESFVIEIVGAEQASILKLAERIKNLNGQTSILIVQFGAQVESLRW